MKKLFIIVFIFLFFTALISAQLQPRLAVIELNATGVSESEADILTGLLETGLVKTESFTIIEQNQMAEILDAQGATLTGCTDESCAIEMGKLLAAEQIVLGGISRLGSKYIANAKIIDVTEGKNIRAEKVDADSLEELMDQMEVLAFMLAGLVAPQSSGSVTMASEFGELFVKSKPEGADIYLNGMNKGPAPVMINKVPAGNNTVEARKGNYYALLEVAVSSGDLKEISMNLSLMKGNLFLKSADPDMEVFFDGKSLGLLGDGLFKDLPSGKHVLIVRSSDKLWESEAELIPGKSITLQVMPREYGNLRIILPEGVTGTLTGKDYKKEDLRDSIQLRDLYTGIYALTTEVNEDYKAWSADRLELKTGSWEIKAEPEHTEGWIKREEERKAAEAELAEKKRLEESEKKRLEQIAFLDRKIIDINAEISDLQQRIDKKQDSRKGKLISGGILSITGIGLGGTGYYFYSEYQQDYTLYNNADTSADAATYRNSLLDNLDKANFSLTGALFSIVTGVIVLLLPVGDNIVIKEYQKEIARLKIELAEKELEKAGLEL